MLPAIDVKKELNPLATFCGWVVFSPSIFKEIVAEAIFFLIDTIELIPFQISAAFSSFFWKSPDKIQFFTYDTKKQFCCGRV